MKSWGTILSKEGFLGNSLYIKVFDFIDRSDFLPDELKKYSDSDEPVPIPFDQTQSAPHMDAIFVDRGGPTEEDTVLEIGTGSGYLTTIMSYLCRRVVSVERIPGLSKWASSNISKYARKNIDLIIGNVNRACLKEKFDLIISTASFREEPDFLIKFIKPNGRIIFPLGSYPPQRLVTYKNGKRKDLGSVAFVNIVD